MLLSITGATVTSAGLSEPAAATSGYLYDIKVDGGTGAVVLLRRIYSNNYLAASVLTIDGSTVTIGDPTYIYSTGTTYADFAYSENAERFAVFYQDDSNSDYGKCKVLDMSFQTTTADKWVGVAESSVLANAQCQYKSIGDITDQLTGLVAGMSYYLDNYGELSTSGTRKFGKALSSTELLITGDA